MAPAAEPAGAAPDPGRRRFLAWLPLKLLDVVALLCSVGVAAAITRWVLGARRGRPIIRVNSADGAWLLRPDTDQVLEVAGPLGNNRIVVRDGSVFVESAPCANQICVKDRPRVPPRPVDRVPAQPRVRGGGRRTRRADRRPQLLAFAASLHRRCIYLYSQSDMMDRILFIDDAQIASSKGVERRIHPARRYHGNPVVTSDRVWEAAEVIVGTVRKEAERYRMWYQTYATGPGRNGFDPFNRSLHLYAESDDGRTWSKPELGITENLMGSHANNITLVRPTFSRDINPSVLYTPHARDGHAYTLFSYGVGHDLPYNGHFVAWSDDGVRWSDGPETPVIPGYKAGWFMYDEVDATFRGLLEWDRGTDPRRDAQHGWGRVVLSPPRPRSRRGGHRMGRRRSRQRDPVPRDADHALRSGSPGLSPGAPRPRHRRTRIRRRDGGPVGVQQRRQDLAPRGRPTPDPRARRRRVVG